VPNPRSARSQRGGVVGWILLALLLLGCVAMVRARHNNAKYGHGTAKNAPCPTLDSALAKSLVDGESGSIIPMKRGLVLTWVWTYHGRDLEQLKTFALVNEREIMTANAGPVPYLKEGKPELLQTNYERIVCQSDFNDSNVLETEVHDVKRIIGTTNFNISKSTLRSLKESRHASLAFRDLYTNVGDGYAWRTNEFGQYFNLGWPANFRAVVNGVETDLPAVVAIGFSGIGYAKLVVLDDPANPLLLDFQMPWDKFGVKIIKINFPVEKKLETDLAEKGRAEIYGIYFDFDSANLRVESEPVLAEIAGILKRNSHWKLSVEGHTDNFGGDSHNLALSQSRSESVKKALVDRYQVAPDLLSTVGFGASRPKTTNDTVEGRALNRRVELVRH
jgi:hypothetical protein